MGNAKKQKKNREVKNGSEKRVMYLLIVLAVVFFLSVFLVLLYRNETKMDRIVKGIYEEYKDNIDLATNTLYDNEVFTSLDSDGQRRAMGRLLDYYEKDNKIRSVYYDGIDYLYMFVYTDEEKYGNYGAAPLKVGEKPINEDDLISSNDYKGKYLA